MPPVPFSLCRGVTVNFCAAAFHAGHIIIVILCAGRIVLAAGVGRVHEAKVWQLLAAIGGLSNAFLCKKG